MKFKSDIDIDFGDRTQALNLLGHHPAGIFKDGHLTKHNTGIYVTDIPVDPFTGIASQIILKPGIHRTTRSII